MNKNLIYFDNAATSGPKPDSVVKAICDCLKNANVEKFFVACTNDFFYHYTLRVAISLLGKSSKFIASIGENTRI